VTEIRTVNKFYRKLGLPRTEFHITKKQKVVVWASIVIFTLLWIGLAIGVVPLGLGRALNAILLFFGAGMRLGAHGQKHQRWTFIDLLGKMFAYYGAFTLLTWLAC